MRNMKCQNVRREIEEAAQGHLLSADADAHLKSCVACETLSREQSKLQIIISSLGTVEVPGDFDFRLRARLAGEKPGAAKPFALAGFSFGMRSAAAATILLLIGSAFLFVSLRTRLAKSSIGTEIASRPLPSSGGNSLKENDGEKVAPAVSIETNEAQTDAVAAGLGSGHEGRSKRRELRSEVASFKGSRSSTRDFSNTPAPVLKREGQLAASYPTAAFPIDASYQSLKVSVDDGRGASRTISLPTVSFGSQRALSQNASPSVSSARGVW
jgi:hypothetical protein